MVTGVEASEESGAGMTPHAQILPGSVEAPPTWYSPFLDVLFGVAS